MCTLFEELVKEGEIKSEARGIILIEKKCKSSDKEISEFLSEALNITLKDAEEYLKKFYKEN